MRQTKKVQRRNRGTPQRVAELLEVLEALNVVLCETMTRYDQIPRRSAISLRLMMNEMMDRYRAGRDRGRAGARSGPSGTLHPTTTATGSACQITAAIMSSDDQRAHSNAN